MIERYLDEFERWTPGSKGEKLEKRRELEAHLRAAEQAGRLEEVMSGFGTPRDAARAFASTPQPASLVRRFFAAVVDYGILVGGLFASSGIAAATGHIRDGDVRLTGRSFSDPYAFLIAGLLVASFLFFVVGNLLLEWRTGRTAGKAVLGLRAVSQDGVALDFGQAVLRRLPLVFSGPLQLIDWVFVFFNPNRQRAFDKVAGTMVIEAPLFAAADHAQVIRASSA